LIQGQARARNIDSKTRQRRYDLNLISQNICGDFCNAINPNRTSGVSTEGCRWAERYDRLLRDIVASQDEIAISVIGAIEPSPLPYT
jgi:hypothetical protein